MMEFPEALDRDPVARPGNLVQKKKLISITEPLDVITWITVLEI